MNDRFLRNAASIALAIALPFAAHAASPAASACPDYFLLSGDLASNSNFEIPEPHTVAGNEVCQSAGAPAFAASAAQDWDTRMDTGTRSVCTKLVPGGSIRGEPQRPPGPSGSTMLRVNTVGPAGGIWQRTQADPSKAYMFSVWLYVAAGQVSIQSRGMVGGPVATTTKVGEWEQLRVCTNSLANTDLLMITNRAPDRGLFYVDRVELVEIPIRE